VYVLTLPFTLHLQVFDHSRNNALVGTITGLARGVFTLDFSPSRESKKLAVAGGDASIRIVDIVEEQEDQDL
jgi:COMPASS component SWD3